MKITLAQQNYIIGDIEYNTRKIIASINGAKESGSVLVVFPELAVCGYSPLDLLEYNDFIGQCTKAIHRIKEHTKDIGVIVGAPFLSIDNPIKRLFNSAYYLYQGEVKQVIHKTLLPAYDVFNETRYFEPSQGQEIIIHQGKRIALTICEDIWQNHHHSECTHYPMDILISQQPELIINISASPFDYTQAAKRHNLLLDLCKKYHLPILYCNTVGGHTDLIFDGGSLIYHPSGKLVAQLPYFQEAIYSIDTDNLTPLYDKKEVSKTELIHDSLIYGIREYFSKLNFKKAILGLSGGVDSALVLALACKALGNENVKAILLPSAFSTEHSVNDSLDLCNRLDVSYHILPIHDTFQSALTSLQPFFNNIPFNVAEENMQARIRSLFLMALSNKHGAILLNTSNKSESAVGYGTLYGDMCGGLSVLGDLYKTEVYECCAFINRKKEIIPQNILTKEPSAELRPNQKDSDSLPPYHVLDKILFLYIEQLQGIEEIVSQGFDSSIVKRVIQLVNNNEHKRFQAPPSLRISPKALGSGRRVPIVAKYDF